LGATIAWPARQGRRQSRQALRFPELKVAKENDRQQQARLLRQISRQ